MERRLSRREVLVGGLAIVVLGPAACTARELQDAQRDQQTDGGVAAADLDDLAGRMRSLIPDVETVALAAAVFIGAIDDDADEETLVQALLDDAEVWHAAGDAALRNHLSDQVRDDYAQRRVTDVGGWIVSITEARLAALVGVAA